MYCRNCGNMMTDGAKFCMKCGTPVDSAMGVNPVIGNAGAMPSGTMQAAQLKQSKGQISGKKAAVIIILATIAIVGLIIWLCESNLGHNTSSSSNNTSSSSEVEGKKQYSTDTIHNTDGAIKNGDAIAEEKAREVINNTKTFYLEDFTIVMPESLKLEYEEQNYQGTIDSDYFDENTGLHFHSAVWKKSRSSFNFDGGKEIFDKWFDNYFTDKDIITSRDNYRTFTGTSSGNGGKYYVAERLIDGKKYFGVFMIVCPIENQAAFEDSIREWLNSIEMKV